MKKNLAAFRYSEQKVIPLYATDAVRGASPVIPLTDEARGGGWAKRGFDILFTLMIALVGMPFYMLIAALIKLTSEGPVLFVQERVGQDGRVFKFYKFRTMLVDNSDAQHRSFAEDFIKGRLMSEEGDRRVFKLQNDPRVTAIGRFLRKTSLDELPQFLNVLTGEMSLVGPRPPIPYELEQYKPWHCRRVLDAKPGITGLWQVSGRSRTTFDEMVRLDLRYARTRSFWTDIKILLATPRAVISGKGAC